MRRLLLTVSIPWLMIQTPAQQLGTHYYVLSCPYADSVIGRDHGDSISAKYLPEVDATRLTILGYDFGAFIQRAGRGPDRNPTSQVTFVVEQRMGAADILADTTGAPPVTLYLDARDSLTLGSGRLGHVSGPSLQRMAPVSAVLTSAGSLRFARAHHAYVRIGPKRMQVIDQNIDLYKRLYRFAVCDSVRAN